LAHRLGLRPARPDVGHPVPHQRGGYQLLGRLEEIGVRYDEHLRRSIRVRRVTDNLVALLGLLAHPPDARWLVRSLDTLLRLEVLSAAGLGGEALRQLHAVLASAHRPETLFLPTGGQSPLDARAPNIASPAERTALDPGAGPRGPRPVWPAAVAAGRSGAGHRRPVPAPAGAPGHRLAHRRLRARPDGCASHMAAARVGRRPEQTRPGRQFVPRSDRRRPGYQTAARANHRHHTTPVQGHGVGHGPYGGHRRILSAGQSGGPFCRRSRFPGGGP